MENNLKDTIEKGKENIKQAKTEYSEKQTLKKKRKFVLKIFRSIIAILVLVLLIVVVKLIVDSKNDEDEPTTNVTYTAQSQFIDSKDIAELKVANITYNSVATITKDGGITQEVFESGSKEEKKNVARYVAYLGEIEVYYDLKNVDIKKDEKNKSYIVIVPSAIFTPKVKDAEFKHIVIDKKSEGSYEPANTRELCLQDLEFKFNKERKEIERIANANMQSAINGYLEFFVEDGYEIKYEVKENNSNEKNN